MDNYQILQIDRTGLYKLSTIYAMPDHWGEFANGFAFLKALKTTLILNESLTAQARICQYHSSIFKGLMPDGRAGTFDQVQGLLAWGLSQAPWPFHQRLNLVIIQDDSCTRLI